MGCGEGLRIFGLGASRDFALAVARALGCGLAALEERTFEDGEHKARALESVRGDDAYIIHSLYGEPGASPNDKLVQLLLFAGSLRAAGAARVTAVVPYLAYARKDQRSKRRDPVSTRHVAGFIESAGCDAIVTLDVHNLAAFENAYRIRADNLAAGPILARRVATILAGAAACAVSPDAGGIKRAARFRAALAAALGRETGFAFVEKSRSAGTVRGGALAGDVAGQVAVVVDDLVSAGTTLDLAARSCLAAGATRVLAAATHGVFAPAADAILGASPIDRILVTDTVPLLRLTNPGLVSRVEHVSVAPLVAEAIARLHAGADLEALIPE